MNKKVVLSIETTGLDMVCDRIIKVDAIKVDERGNGIDRYTTLVRPSEEFTITKEATEVNGITVDDVLSMGRETSQVLRDLVAFKDGCDVVGYNLLNFDLPFLQHECDRYGIDLRLDDNGYLVDSFLIETMQNSHSLDAVNARCGGAEDCSKSEKICNVFRNQCTKYDKGVFDEVLNEGEETKMCVDRCIVKRDGEYVMNFGQHKDERVEDVILKDVGYIRWMCTKMGITMPTRRLIKHIAEMLYAKQNRAM